MAFRKSPSQQMVLMSFTVKVSLLKKGTEVNLRLLQLPSCVTVYLVDPDLCSGIVSPYNKHEGVL